MSKYLLGIDVGTTNTKATLLSESGSIIASSSCSYEISTPDVSMQEQSADDLWNAVVKTSREVCSHVSDKENVAAVSLSCQGGTLILTDEAFRPIAPAIVWSDTRAKKEAVAFAEAFGEDYLYRTTGWHLENGMVAMQLLWLKENCRDLFDRASHVLSVPDYIAARLTGIPELDPADAGIDQLYDIRKNAYDKAILRYIGIDEEKLGIVSPTGTVIGPLTFDAAEAIGITQKTVLVNGVHDQYAVSVGAGCTGSGDVLVGTGTAWVVAALSREWDFANGFSESHSAIPGLKGSILSLSSGGVSLEWLRKNVLSGETLRSYKDIDRIAESVGPGAGGVLFYPYFTGAHYPKENKDVRATFLGLDLSHKDGNLARAVMEGVVYEIAWMLEAFRKKFPIRSIKITGGAVKSPLWPSILADVTGIRVTVPEVADLAPVGAALIAGVGCGVFPDHESAYERLNLPEKTILPDPVNEEKYKMFYRNYKKGAEALQMIGSDRGERL